MRLSRREQRVSWLRRVPLFADLSTAQLEGVAPFVDEVETEAGHVLMEQGEFGQELLIIVDGTAEVTRDGRHMRDVGPGDVIGEISLLDGRPRTATVVTREPTTVLSISKRAFDTVLDRVPGLPHELLRALAARLRDATDATDDTNDTA
jgi:CRP/FNR family transcriptional regulator/CRP/FNR family cyclic AMP-dependent transcriptional regulator